MQNCSCPQSRIAEICVRCRTLPSSATEPEEAEACITLVHVFLQMSLLRNLAGSRPARIFKLMSDERERFANAFADQDVIRYEEFWTTLLKLRRRSIAREVAGKRRTIECRSTIQARARIDHRQERIGEESRGPGQEQERDDRQREYRELRIDEIASQGSPEFVLECASLAAIKARRVLRRFPPCSEALCVYES